MTVGTIQLVRVRARTWELRITTFGSVATLCTGSIVFCSKFWRNMKGVKHAI